MSCRSTTGAQLQSEQPQLAIVIEMTAIVTNFDRDLVTIELQLPRALHCGASASAHHLQQTTTAIEVAVDHDLITVVVEM